MQGGKKVKKRKIVNIYVNQVGRNIFSFDVRDTAFFTLTMLRKPVFCYIVLSMIKILIYILYVQGYYINVQGYYIDVQGENSMYKEYKGIVENH